MGNSDKSIFNLESLARGERLDTYPILMFSASWINSRPHPLWSCVDKSNRERSADAPEFQELLHLCHSQCPDQPQLVATGLTTQTFDTDELGKTAKANLNLPLIITCLFDGPYLDQAPDPGPRGVCWQINHTDVREWWLLIETHLGYEAVPPWIINLQGSLCRQLSRGTIAPTVLTDQQINELYDCLAKAFKASGLPPEEIDDSAEAALFWQWELELSMGCMSTPQDADDDDCGDWHDYLLPMYEARFGIFVTQSLCNWLTDQAEDIECATPISNGMRRFLIENTPFLRSSGGILITNEHFY